MTIRILLLLIQINLYSSDFTSKEYFILEDSNYFPRYSPFNITKIIHDPIMTTGKDNDWDSTDILNPSVIKYNGMFYNYYSGFNGKIWRTGLATSKNGKKWMKSLKNPILDISPASWDSQYIAANGSALVENNKVLYFYQGKNNNGVTQIGLAESKNGIDFTKYKSPILTTGKKNSWDSKAVADPYIIKHKGKFYLFYLGMDKFNTQRLGVAMSSDGVSFIKNTLNPILDIGAKNSFDENGLGEPSVIFFAPYFYMIYTGRNIEEKRNLGYALSLNGINWKKISYKGLFQDKNKNKWNKNVICDSSLIYNQKENFLYVFYGGGNKAKPDENINGKIGLFYVDLFNLTPITEFNANNFLLGDSVSNYIYNSYPIESNSNNDYYIWVKDEIKFKLNIIKNANYIIKGWIPFKLHKKENAHLKRIKISIKINGEDILKKDFFQDSSFKLIIDKKYFKDQDSASFIEIKSSSVFTPSNISNSKDSRNLSFTIKSIEPLK